MADGFDDLIEEHGEGNVKKALWLQDKIRKEGLDGIHFMKYAEEQVIGFAHLITYQSIRSEMKKRF